MQIFSNLPFFKNIPSTTLWWHVSNRFGFPNDTMCLSLSLLSLLWHPVFDTLTVRENVQRLCRRVRLLPSFRAAIASATCVLNSLISKKAWKTCIALHCISQAADTHVNFLSKSLWEVKMCRSNNDILHHDHSRESGEENSVCRKMALLIHSLDVSNCTL